MSHSNVLERVVELIGIHATIRLVRLKGGQDLSFPLPQNLHYLNWLVVEVGMEEAIRLCEFYRGSSIKLPIEVNSLLQLRNKAMAEDFKQGESITSISLKYGVDRKLVQMVLDKFGLRTKEGAECQD